MRALRASYIALLLESDGSTMIFISRVPMYLEQSKYIRLIVSYNCSSLWAAVNGRNGRASDMVMQ